MFARAARLHRFREPVPDPGLLNKNTPLYWSDSLTAGYIKSLFRKRILRTTECHNALTTELIQTVTRLHEKKCDIREKTAATAIIYCGILQQLNASWHLYDTYKHAAMHHERIYTAMISSAAKSGKIEEIAKVFSLSSQHGVSISIDGWNAAFSLMVSQPNAKSLTANLLKKMQQHNIKPDIVTHNIILKASENSFAAEERFRSLTQLSTKDFNLTPNSRTYGSLLYVYAKFGQSEKFDLTLQAMQSKGIATKTTHVALLTLQLCRTTNSLDKAFYVVDDVMENPEAPDYLLTNRIAAVFISICTSHSKKRGDRADRYVDMCWHECERQGILQEFFLLSRFLSHYDSVGRTSCIHNLCNYMKYNSIRTSSFIDRIFKKHKKPQSQRQWKPKNDQPRERPVALTRDELIMFVVNNKVSEIQPAIYRLCRSLDSSEQYKMIDLVKFASSEILKQKLKLNLSKDLCLNHVGVVLLLCSCTYYSMKQRQFSIKSVDLFSCFIPEEKLGMYERQAAIVVC